MQIGAIRISWLFLRRLCISTVFHSFHCASYTFLCSFSILYRVSPNFLFLSYHLFIAPIAGGVAFHLKIVYILSFVVVFCCNLFLLFEERRQQKICTVYTRVWLIKAKCITFNMQDTTTNMLFILSTCRM